VTINAGHTVDRDVARKVQLASEWSLPDGRGAVVTER
jgi:hypothetical protein